MHIKQLYPYNTMYSLNALRYIFIISIEILQVIGLCPTIAPADIAWWQHYTCLFFFACLFEIGLTGTTLQNYQSRDVQWVMIDDKVNSKPMLKFS